VSGVPANGGPPTAPGSSIVGRIYRWFAWRTRHARQLPDFLIIGAQRAGTTSLHRYIEGHPRVCPPPVKEVHYFDNRYQEGLAWYRSFFPTRAHLRLVERLRGGRCLTGEATPYYLFHPHAPRRAFESLSSTKLIVLLRNPVDRAYSHYHHSIRMGLDDAATFEDALAREGERLAGESEKMLADETYFSFAHQHHSYLARGIYVDQLLAWRQYFPAERLLVLKSENLYEDPTRTFTRVLSFLELSAWRPSRFPSYNRGDNPAIEAGLRRRLARFFAPHNRRLYELLDEDFCWNEEAG